MTIPERIGKANIFAFAHAYMVHIQKIVRELGEVEARRRLEGLDRVSVRTALLPNQMPSGRFDLIVVSELLYYMRLRDADRLVRKLAHAIVPGGRIVLLHHHTDFNDAAQKPDLAQKRACTTLSKRMVLRYHYRDRRFDCASFVAR